MKIKQFLQEYAIIIAIILTIIVTAALNFANFIPNEDIVSYLLLADVGLAISVLNSSLKHEKSISDVIDQLKIKSMSKKVTRKDHYRLLNAAVNNSKSEICIMTIDSALKSTTINTIPEREVYYNNIEKIAKKRQEISIRRIHGLPVDEDARKDKIKWILSELKRVENCPNYHVRIFDWRKFDSIPTPLSLQIVDDVFVGLVNMQHASTSLAGGGEDICIEDTNVVQHLKLYYDAIWEKCEELKIGTSIKYDVLTEK